MPLQRFLKARHGDRPASHWTTITAAECEVKTMEISWACSQRGMCSFATTCRSAEVREEKFLANFKDNFSEVTCKEVRRP